MSWNDDEIDEMFKEAADQQYFEFKPEYFADIEKQLPIRRSRKPFFWWFSSSVFLAVFLGWGILEGTNFNQKRSSGSADDTNAGKVLHAVEPAAVNGHHGAGQVERSTETNGVQKDGAKLPVRSNDMGLADEAVVEAGSTIPAAVENNSSMPDSEEPMAVAGTSVETDQSIASLALIDISTTYKTADMIPSTMYGGTKKNISFYLEFGGGIGQGWVSTHPATVNGSAFVNGGIGTRFGRFNLTAGLGMRASKLGDLQIMERTKIYGFGYSTYENQYTFKTFYSLEAPLHVNYTAGRHSIGIGAVPSYNICTGLTRTEWIDGMQTVQRSGVSNVGLFSKVGLTGSVGYAYAVKENTQIGARAAVQMFEPLSSDRFVGNRVKMPVEGQVFIRRTFELKK